jgi:hypothetical protein
MIGYQDKINQILRGAETIKNMTNRPNLTEEEKEHYNKVAMDLIYKDTDLELSVSVLTKTLEKVQLERDALWVKTQQDEREINDLRDVNKELRNKIKVLEEIVAIYTYTKSSNFRT